MMSINIGNKLLCGFVILALWISPYSNACGDDDLTLHEISGSIDSLKSQTDLEAEWTKFEISQHQEWLKMKADIESKWQKLVLSNRRTWVEYDKTFDTRSRVDFKNGDILIETISIADSNTSLAQIKNKIADHIRHIYHKKQMAGDAILKDQLESQTGEKVTAATIDQFIRNEALTEIKKDIS